jgi:hypothetical protein
MSSNAKKKTSEEEEEVEEEEVDLHTASCNVNFNVIMANSDWAKNECSALSENMTDGERFEMDHETKGLSHVLGHSCIPTAKGHVAPPSSTLE